MDITMSDPLPEDEDVAPVSPEDMEGEDDDDAGADDDEFPEDTD